MKVIKRDGSKQDLDLARFHKVAQHACEGIAGVSVSDLEIKTQIQVFNLIIQIELKNETKIELSEERVSNLYDKYINACKDLMMEKNHDYGEVWRNMQVSTFTDMLLMRIHRMRQILENDGKTIMSEGIDSNLMDMVNYSVFALIRMKE